MIARRRVVALHGVLALACVVASACSRSGHSPDAEGNSQLTREGDAASLQLGVPVPLPVGDAVSPSPDDPLAPTQSEELRAEEEIDRQNYKSNLERLRRRIEAARAPAH